MTTNVQLNQVMALIRVGELAMEMYRAQADASQAREAYYDEVKAFEAAFAGGQRLKVDPGNPMYTQRRACTNEEFLALEAAKKKAYCARRKLLKACEAISNPPATGGAK